MSANPAIESDRPTGDGRAQPRFDAFGFVWDQTQYEKLLEDTDDYKALNHFRERADNPSTDPREDYWYVEQFNWTIDKRADWGKACLMASIKDGARLVFYYMRADFKEWRKKKRTKIRDRMMGALQSLKSKISSARHPAS